jgi:hypothetical protein
MPSENTIQTNINDIINNNTFKHTSTRFAVINEPDTRNYINTELLMTITGGDTLRLKSIFKDEKN